MKKLLLLMLILLVPVVYSVTYTTFENSVIVFNDSFETGIDGTKWNGTGNFTTTLRGKHGSLGLHAWLTHGDGLYVDRNVSTSPNGSLVNGSVIYYVFPTMPISNVAESQFTIYDSSGNLIRIGETSGQPSTDSGNWLIYDGSVWNETGIEKVAAWYEIRVELEYPLLNISINGTSVYTRSDSPIDNISRIRISSDSLSFASNATYDLVSISRISVDEANVTYNISDLVETSLQSFSFIISNASSNMTDINSILVYNGTEYSYDSKTTLFNETTFNYTFNIPFITSNETSYDYSFYFNYNYTTSSIQSRKSDVFKQTAYQLILTNCTETTTNITTHFIVKDETTDANITSSAISSLFNTWISYNYPNTAYMKNFSISSNNTDYMDVCIYPEWAEYKTDIFLQYSATNYDSRDWIKEAYILNNATKINNLYLLLTSTSSLITVIVTDENDNYYPNVLIDMESYNIADGSYKLIEIEITNENGEAIFSYDPDTYYRFILYVDGVEKKRTEKAKITSTPLNIQIEAEGVGFIPFSAGIIYSFSPSNIVLLNNTNYTFNFNLDSSYWAITNCILYLKNGTTILSQSSSSFNTSNCNISINYNTGNFTSIISQAVYELNTTANETVSVEYNIRYTYVGQFSLKNFLDDLKDFGELGFNDFTRMFIAFIVILGIISTLAFKYSLREPEVLTFLSWALVLFFSYIGWFTLNFNAIPEIKGLATGWLKQYIFFILFSLASGFYIIKKHVE